MKQSVFYDKRAKVIPTPTFAENEMHHCQCCNPPRRTIIVPRSDNRESWLCPRTGVVMFWSEGAQTYIQGSRRLT